MDDEFGLAGLALGVVSMLAYVLAKLRRGERPTINDGVSVLSSGVALGFAGKLCWFAFWFRASPTIQGLSIQMFVGGIVLAWVAIENLVKLIRGR